MWILGRYGICFEKHQNLLERSLQPGIQYLYQPMCKEYKEADYMIEKCIPYVSLITAILVLVFDNSKSPFIKYTIYFLAVVAIVLFVAYAINHFKA